MRQGWFGTVVSGYKRWRLHLLCLQVICTKVRDGAKRIVRLKEGSAKGRHVVIVDDLVQSGSTLLECGKLLKAQVCIAYSRAAPHMLQDFVPLL